VRLLAFSDLHNDVAQAGRLVQRAGDADAVIGAGDFASVHRGLEATIDALSAIDAPTLLVPGNNETDEALREAAADWSSASVLHGDSVELDGHSFFGLGGGIPVTPWDWSFDLNEEQAAEALERCPEGAVMVIHSPPRGHCDRSGGGDSLGSESVLGALERKRPPLLLCGHIHESWGCESRVGPTKVINLGPEGRLLELPE
jgi:Icc-related predicted phosphoesterase